MLPPDPYIYPSLGHLVGNTILFTAISHWFAISLFVQFSYHPVQFKVTICESSVVLLAKPVESTQRAIVKTNMDSEFRVWQGGVLIRHELPRLEMVSIKGIEAVSWIFNSLKHHMPPSSAKWVLVPTCIVSATFISAAHVVSATCVIPTFFSAVSSFAILLSGRGDVDLVCVEDVMCKQLLKI